MIEVRNIVKTFGNQSVLTDVSCTFHPGRNNLIIGQSGSGKTVLMKCLIGLLTPDCGQVLFDGQDILQIDADGMKRLREKIGVLFQNSALFDSMTVGENVRFPLRMFGTMPARQQDERMHFCLERVNLSGCEDKYPAELSGGMRKRVAIARAIALNPQYLFCDEPNSGLDPQTSIVIDHLIDDITKEYGITTIVNTHDMNSVIGIGDHIVFLSHGRAAWSGTKDDVLSTTCPALRDFLFASPTIRQMCAVRESH